MKHSIKTFVVLLITVILCISNFTLISASTTIPEATPEFYVNDFANILSEEDESILMNKALTLANENDGIQIVVSTIESLNGDTVENYATQMYNKYGIGKNDMGLLILLSTGDRQIRVEVGKAMERYINDSKAGRFMDNYAIPYLKDNKFDEGIISLQDALINEIVTCVSAENNVAPTSEPLPDIDFSIVFGVLGVILLLALLIFLIVLISKKIEKLKELISNLNDQIANLKKANSRLNARNASDKQELTKVIGSLEHNKHALESSLSKVQNELANLKDRYSRVLKIYPDTDTKVDEMIKTEQIARDKRIAASVDSHISDVIDLGPDKDIVLRLSSVISEYEHLTSDQKTYIKNDISKLKNLYILSLHLEEEYQKELEKERIKKRKKDAKSVTEKILAVISAIGCARAHHLYKLNDAKDLYDDLDHETKKFVDHSVISKLDSLISAAKRDKEDEERRRRESSYNSYSSSSRSSSSFGSSGFGGFGGSSGGGGASRGF